MKMISRSLASSCLGLLVISAAAHAHGLHAPVEPRFHLLVHLLQLASVVALMVIVCLWARKRARR